MADEDDMEEDGYDGLEDVYDDSDEDYLLAADEVHLDENVVDDDEEEEEKEEEEADGNSDEKIKFDQSLPSSHTYLGEEMDEVGGRTVMEDDNIVSIPLMSFPKLLLVPGQTLPLHLFQPQLVAMMKNLLDKDKTFGVVTNVHSHRGNAEDLTKNLTGTTCEIFSVKEETEAGISSIRVKAMARKRFQVISLRSQVDGTRIGTVRILPDIVVPAYPNDVVPESIKSNRMVTSSSGAKERLRKTSRKLGPSCSVWPVWVYELYNPYLLMARIKSELKSWTDNLNMNTLPTEPTEFSYWVTHNLPLDDKLRHLLLKHNCPIQRLRKQLEIMQQYGIMICEDCETTIADKKDLFCMSLGLMGAYVNPGGYVHETVTFHKAKGLRLRGSPSTEHSWFPGYAWTIAECRHCGNHMGWKFTAVDKKLIPAKFWGLTRASLRPSLRHEEQDK